MSYSLANCALELPIKFGNRQNLGFLNPGTMTATNALLADNSLAMLALLQAVQQLTETFEFEELKYQTPVPPATTLQMTTGNPVIPISDLLATIQGNSVYPQFQNQNIVDITDVYTFWVWFSNTPSTAGRTLKYRRVTTIDTYSYGITSDSQGTIGVAPPVYYTRFGNQLQVGPAPNQNFNYFLRVKLRHPSPVALNNQFGSGSGGQLLSNFFPASLLAVLAVGSLSSVTIVSGGQGYMPNFSFPIVFDANGSGVVPSGWKANSNASGVIVSITAGTTPAYSSVPNCYTAAMR